MQRIEKTRFLPGTEATYCCPCKFHSPQGRKGSKAARLQEIPKGTTETKSESLEPPFQNKAVTSPFVPQKRAHRKVLPSFRHFRQAQALPQQLLPKAPEENRKDTKGFFAAYTTTHQRTALSYNRPLFLQGMRSCPKLELLYSLSFCCVIFPLPIHFANS
jgi:hypothetical protein